MANGCGGCGKPKPGPHGGAKPAGTVNPKPSTPMTSQTESFQLNLVGGEKVMVTGSLLEAQATLMRLGGQGTIDC